MQEPIDGDPDVVRRSLAHDLLQSVSIIQAIVAATRLSELDAEQLDANLAMVESEAQVMARLCQHHLDGPHTLGPVDVAAVTHDVVGRMQAVYTGRIEAEADDVRLAADDALEWERCLLNLVENACRAAGPDGKVLVRCFAQDDAVHVSVGDSGPGFGEAPAGRASLGMAGVSRLVDRLGGHLELRRSPLGGAQLTIVVPSSR